MPTNFWTQLQCNRDGGQTLRIDPAGSWLKHTGSDPSIPVYPQLIIHVRKNIRSSEYSQLRLFAAQNAHSSKLSVALNFRSSENPQRKISLEQNIPSSEYLKHRISVAQNISSLKYTSICIYPAQHSPFSEYLQLRISITQIMVLKMRYCYPVIYQPVIFFINWWILGKEVNALKVNTSKISKI